MERIGLKNRMLGNIRFVGELYKQSLLNTSSVYSCFNELLGNEKKTFEDPELELVCHLIKTVGETLENKSTENQLRMFDEYFAKIRGFSKDKTLNSRIRFNMDEIVELRKNDWIARRQQEGPLKISEIHQRVKQEEEKQQVQQQQQQQRQQNQGDNRRGGDARSYSGAQQQQMQPKILSRSKDQQPHGRQGGGSGGGDVKFGRTSSVGPGVAVSNNDNRSGSSAEIRRLNSSSAVLTTGGKDSGVRKEIKFEDDAMFKIVKTAVSDYVVDGDITGVQELNGSPPIIFGYFVLHLIKRFVEANSKDKPEKMLEMLNEPVVLSSLLTARREVEKAVESCDVLKLLPDIVLDTSEVPFP